MPGKVINLLTDVKTQEVSLVRRGANNKRFALTKSEDQDMKFAELLKTVLATEAEGEKELVTTLKAAKASDEAIEVAVANFRMQSGFKDMISKEVFSEVTKAAGFGGNKAPPFGSEEEEKEDPKKPGFMMNGKKMPKAKKSIEGMPEGIRKEFEEQQATIERLEKSAADSVAVVVALRKEADRKEYIAKCAKEFPNVPGLSTEEMGEKLQTAYEVSKEFGEQQEKEWASVSAALGSSALLVSKGANHAESDSSTPEGKIQAIAKELRAGDSKLTEEGAVAKAWSENPGLYAEYQNNNPAQTGR